ncbi:hypothetical protein N7526_009458 [Penicillium atrosanguineum]|nr:hypothetical protein N7526_009458 [Penicillium atrosanguineum]
MRPRKAKNPDDDDDAPVYVDEESNEVISKEDYQALKKRKQAKAVGDDKLEEEAKPTSEEKSKASVRKPKKGKKIKLSFDEE